MSVLVPTKSPGLSAVFMAAAVSILLLFVARILFLFVRLWFRPMVRPESQEKESSSLSMSFVSNSRGRSLHWNTLPASLPFTLALPEKPSSRVGNGVGVGLSHKRSQSLPVIVWQPRTGPQFQPPPPALYENPMPVSMAKMIMSRHTFRRPGPNRSRRSSSVSSPRPASPPQTPSRLYHSLA